jgi:hypothetical protein
MNILSEEIISNFRSHHLNIGNILTHLIALGFIFLSLRNILKKIININYLYIFFILLYGYYSIKILIILIIFFYVCNFIPKVKNIKSFKINFGILILAYLTTNLSHFIFDESTYSSSYKNNSYEEWIKTKIIHNLFLPILIIDSLIFKKNNFDSGNININNISNVGINNTLKNNDKKIFNSYLKKDDYNIYLDDVIKKFLKKNNLKNYNYKFVEDIDELYSTNSNISNMKELDKVVEKYHIDGHIPNWLSFIRTYRILILINKDKNDDSQTFFINQEYKENDNYWIFDYNGQVHKALLDKRKNKKEKRILIKKHFIIYPKNTYDFLIELYKKTLIYTNKYMRYMQNNFNIRCRYISIFIKILSNIRFEIMRPIALK